MNNVSHANISSLMDFRNAASRKVVDGKIVVEKQYPNLDYLYGPYSSEGTKGQDDYKSALLVAFDALSEKTSTGNDGLMIGKTVGIINENGSISEYWFKSACSVLSDLVPKNNDSTADLSAVSVNYEYEQLRIKGLDSDTDKYYIPMQLLEILKASISVPNINIITGDAYFNISYPTGCTLKASVDDDDLNDCDGTLTIPTGYVDNDRNYPKTYTVNMLVSKYDMTANSTLLVTVLPKVHLDDVTTTWKNKYLTETTVTFKKSVSLNGNALTVYTAPKSKDIDAKTNELMTSDVTITIQADSDGSYYKQTTFKGSAFSVSASDTTYSNESDKYVSDTKILSKDIILGAMKVYYGLSLQSSLTSKLQIVELGNSIEDDTIQGHECTITGTTSAYLYVGCTNALTIKKAKDSNGGTTDIFELDEVTSPVSNYHLYRCGPIDPTRIKKFYINI